jgi:hypothetical protein
MREGRARIDWMREGRGRIDWTRECPYRICWTSEGMSEKISKRKKANYPSETSQGTYIGTSLQNEPLTDLKFI